MSALLVSVFFFLPCRAHCSHEVLAHTVSVLPNVCNLVLGGPGSAVGFALHVFSCSLGVYICMNSEGLRQASILDPWLVLDCFDSLRVSS